MSDEADLGNEEVQQSIDLARKLINPKPMYEATGMCLNEGCDEKLPEGVRWCSPECRDDFERDQKRRR